MSKAVQRGSGQSTGTTMGSASQRGAGVTTDGSPTDKADVLAEGLRRADEAWTAERENVSEARDCQAFYVGGAAQWDNKARDQRVKKNRPVLTINRLPQFVRQMTGDVRKNPPALKCLPARGKASKETAEALNGIIRNIEQQSQAKDVYVKAVENAAQTGQGFFQIETEYSSDDAFDLDIRIRPILDPCGALIDPFAQLFDKSDMRYAFTFEFMSVEDFRSEYPNSAAVDMPVGWSAVPGGYQWRVGDAIRIGGYWRKVPVKKTIYLMPDGSVVEEVTPPLQPVKQREVETHKVEMYRMTGADILSGPHEWAGRYIPICMVVGEEITSDGKTTRKGMVHDARDPQRIYNYSRSASVEAVALQPKAPFIGTVDQFKGRKEWETAGSENHAFLAYNPDPKYPTPPQRSQPAIASAGMDTQAAIAASDMQGVTGIYNDSLGAPSQQHSGVAINAKKVEGDTGTFLYPDNLSRAIGYAGKILVDLIPRIYDNERVVRVLKEDGATEMVTVNGPPKPMMGKNGQPMPVLGPDGQPMLDELGQPQTKPAHPMYDLSAGEYDVVVTTGPSFATQRQEATANKIEMARAWPPLMDAAADLVLKDMDWQGVDELVARLQEKMGVPKEGEPPPPPPPPPPDVIAKAEKDAADAGKTRAETQQTEVETATMLVQLQASIAQIQAMLAGGAPMGGPPGASPPGAGPMPAPPPAPDMPPPGNDMPPMVEVPNDLPPMVEVETTGFPQGVGPV